MIPAALVQTDQICSVAELAKEMSLIESELHKDSLKLESVGWFALAAVFVVEMDYKLDSVANAAAEVAHVSSLDTGPEVWWVVEERRMVDRVAELAAHQYDEEKEVVVGTQIYFGTALRADIVDSMQCVNVRAVVRKDYWVR